MGHLHADNLRHDLPASVVVFLVATPLCLGIALASGAPLSAGIIAGIVGGLVVGSASGSALGVSGPAAGLAVIVLNAIGTLGSWETFLLAVVLAGGFQIALGYLSAGAIAYYFPSSVIKGMLAGIGLTIILKQLPHAVGYDAAPEGAIGYAQANGENTFSAVSAMFAYVHPGAILVTLFSLLVLLLWEQPVVRRLALSKWVQGPLAAVVVGIGLNQLFALVAPTLAIEAKHLVQLPVPDSIREVRGFMTAPDFSQFGNPAVYTVALTLAVVASLETLLCVEATDRLDPLRRHTCTNRELKAQGLGNVVSGMLGGLPVTQVIVRSSANIQSGARTKLSTIIHGALLLVAAVFMPTLLNLIPLATLAAILFTVGAKLAKPALFAEMLRLGRHQFVPFTLTVVGILATDLLIGIGLGVVAAAFFILLAHYSHAFFLERPSDGAPGPVRLLLSDHVSFLNRASIKRTLEGLPPGSRVEIDATRTVSLDHDVIETVREFQRSAPDKGIEVAVRGLLSLHRQDAATQRSSGSDQRQPSAVAPVPSLERGTA